VLTATRLAAILKRERGRGRRIVFTNGVFDIIHAGHVRYLKAARALGDALVVGVNSDSSVRRIKGPKRPLVPCRERAEILASLSCVDWVVPFGSDTPERLIHTLHPDVLVKGADWAKEKIVGGDFVESTGGKVARIRLAKGRSTTNIIKRVVERYGR
jgi:rfaE bifunctional protein nucleotidyltransferase chain/domain